MMLAVISACGRGDLDQSSPQAVIDSARELVVGGRPDRLTDLIWAESDDMRGVLDALGRVLGRLDELAETVQGKFPEDLKNMKAVARVAKRKPCMMPMRTPASRMTITSRGV